MVKEITEITEAEARIHAHVSGDGCLYKGKLKRSPSDLKNHKRINIYQDVYKIYYCNNESVLLNSFSNDVKEVYGRSSGHRKNVRELKGKWVYERLKRLGAGKSKEWFIHKEIMEASDKVAREWLKAFFDDEAYIDLRKLNIALNSVNLSGLKQIQELLKRFK